MPQIDVNTTSFISKLIPCCCSLNSKKYPIALLNKIPIKAMYIFLFKKVIG